MTKYPMTKYPMTKYPMTKASGILSSFGLRYSLVIRHWVFRLSDGNRRPEATSLHGKYAPP